MGAIRKKIRSTLGAPITKLYPVSDPSPHFEIWEELPDGSYQSKSSRRVETLLNVLSTPNMSFTRTVAPNTEASYISVRDKAQTFEFEIHPGIIDHHAKEKDRVRMVCNFYDRPKFLSLYGEGLYSEKNLFVAKGQIYNCAIQTSSNIQFAALYHIYLPGNSDYSRSKWPRMAYYEDISIPDVTIELLMKYKEAWEGHPNVIVDFIHKPSEGTHPVLIASRIV